MKDELTVIYNGSCPICSREIAMYRSRADQAGADVRFLDLTETDLTPYGLTRDTAARRFYAVAPDGGLIEGVPAFAAMWDRLPGLRWLARLVRLPGLRTVAELVYNRLAAPALYHMHLRRERRAERGTA